MQDFYNNIKIKILLILISVFLIIFSSTNTYSLQTIDSLAYVVALGLDYSENNNLKLSIQLAKPSDISSVSTTSSSEQSSSSVLNSVECSSIQEGINLLDSHISRTINLSHCKIVAISEKLAYNDISDHISYLANNLQISSHSNILITKCDASLFLEMTNPTLENFSARYYEIINTSNLSTSFTENTTIINFYSSYTSDFKDSVAILSGINNDLTHNNKLSGSYLNKDNSYVAGQTPIKSQNNVENMGLAVFKNGKIIGELNGIESICHSIISNELKYSYIQIKDPNDITKTIDLRLQLAKPTNTKIRLLGNSPYIEIDINLNGQIDIFNKANNYKTDENINNLEAETNKYLEKIIYNYLYKVSKQYNTDIDGLGKHAINNFNTIEKWKKYNWLNNFKNCVFKVNINSRIKSNTTTITI